MIFNPQDKTYQTRSDQPNENWTDDDSYIAIPDGSELAQKIIANYPWFDIVYDDGGNIVDVTPAEPEPTEASIPEDDISVRLTEIEAGLIELAAIIGGNA